MFAAKMMSKMGWKPGQGLGKNNQGRVHNVVGSLKNDTIGVGVHDSLATSWEDMFNKAASAIKIESSSKSKAIAIKLVKAEKKDIQYNGFVKSTADASNICKEETEERKRKKYMYENRMSGKLKRLTDFDSGKDSSIKLVLDTLEETKRKPKKSNKVEKKRKRDSNAEKSVKQSQSVKKAKKATSSSKLTEEKPHLRSSKSIDKERQQRRSKKDKPRSTKSMKKTLSDSCGPSE